MSVEIPLQRLFIFLLDMVCLSFEICFLALLHVVHLGEIGDLMRFTLLSFQDKSSYDCINNMEDNLSIGIK
jgi:hypothetical protein